MVLNDSARAHSEKYWCLSRERFEAADYTLAAFLAITLLEEVGKVVILKDAKMGDVVAKKEFRKIIRVNMFTRWGSTLAVNSRVTRVYGKDEIRFAEWFCNEELFAMRNSALYLELQGADRLYPSKPSAVPRRSWASRAAPDTSSRVNQLPLREAGAPRQTGCPSISRSFRPAFRPNEKIPSYEL
jgi:AbiV family abortive infection protein